MIFVHGIELLTFTEKLREIVVGPKFALYVQWYKSMIVNEKKHQALILGKTEHNFCFLVKNSIDIFRMTIDNRFSCDNHVSVICKKINNQFNAQISETC